MKNIFEDIPANLETEIFESLVGHDNVHIERIISKGHTSPESGWYDQQQNEWVILMQGEAVLSFADGSAQHLKPGDYLNIPAHTKHKVQQTAADVETIWLAVHY